MSDTGDSRLTILLVEDEHIIALAEQQTLARNGYDVIHASNGASAVEHASSDKSIDLILMDINLGDGIDGAEAARQILANRDIPILFLSSHSDREIVERVKDITGYGFVVKSAGEFVLLESISTAFELHAARQDAEHLRQRYQSLFDNASDAVLVVDPVDNSILEFNAAARDLYLLSSARTDQIAYSDLWDPAHVPPRPLLGSETAPYRAFHQAMDGRPLVVEVAERPALIEGRAVRLASVRDLTSQVGTELEYRTAIAAAMDGFWIVDREAVIEDVSPAYARMVGYSRDELVGMHVSDIDVEESREEAVAHVVDVRNGRFERFEARHRRKDGSRIDVEVSASQIGDGSGRIVAFMRDITVSRRERRIAEARARLSDLAVDHSTERLLTAFLDEAEELTDSEIGFFHFVNEDQVTIDIQAWSTRTVELFCDIPEKMRMHYPISTAGVWVDCVKERRPVIHNDYESLTHKKGMPEGHTPIVREVVVPVIRGGLIHAILGVGNKKSDYLATDVNVLEQLASSAWDMVIRRRAEEELSHNRANLAAVMESNDAPILSVDGEMRLLTANEQGIEHLRRITGRRIEIGESIRGDEDADTDVPNHVVSAWVAIVERAMNGESYAFEQRYPVDGPVESVIEYAVRPVMLNDVITGVAIIGRDVTARARSEEDRERTLREKDDLMEELNHRVKNNLLLVDSLISFKEHSLPGDDDLADLRAQIAAVRQMHEKLSPSTDAMLIPVRPYVRDIVSTLIATRIGAMPDVQLDLDDIELPAGRAVPLGLIANELCTNAIKYGFRNAPGDSLSVSIRSGAGMCRLTVSNTGNPFPPDLDIGTVDTLGLRLVRALVQQLNGEMRWETQGETRFEIQVPCAADSPAADSPAADGPAADSSPTQ